MLALWTTRKPPRPTSPHEGARPTQSAQWGPVCTRTPSQPRHPLPYTFTVLTAWSGERPFLYRKNLQEETSLWDNLLRSCSCPVSRLCRPADVGLVLIASSRGIDSPIPSGVRVHTRVWTATNYCSWELKKNEGNRWRQTQFLLTH